MQVPTLTPDIQQQAEAAVAWIHHHHVVHGDLSGTNLFLVQDSPLGSPAQSSGGGFGSGSSGSDSSQPCTEGGSGSSVAHSHAADSQAQTSSRVVVLDFGGSWVSDDISSERHRDFKRLHHVFAQLGT
jgi:serine/threonine protein kinase